MDGVVFHVHAKKNVKAMPSSGSAYDYTTQFMVALIDSRGGGEDGRVITPSFSFRVTATVKQYFLEHFKF